MGHYFMMLFTIDPPTPPPFPTKRIKEEKSSHNTQEIKMPSSLKQCINFITKVGNVTSYLRLKRQSALKSGKRITRQTTQGRLYFMLLRVWEKESSPLLLYLSGIFSGTTSSCCVCWCFSKSLHNVVSQPHPNQ